MAVSRDGVLSPASKLMDEAIELAIEGRPVVPEHSAFIDADTPHTDQEVRWAAEKGSSAVVVAPDGSIRSILSPEEVLGGGRDAA
jgi:hypothetical protein